MKYSIFLFIALYLSSCQGVSEPSVARAQNVSDKVVVYPAPINEALNKDYRMTVDNREVPVYNARVASFRQAAHQYGAGSLQLSASNYEHAGMAYFDLLQGPVKVTVGYKENIRSAFFTSCKEELVPDIQGNTVSFVVRSPKTLR
ncbi:MAG: hypothetical protein LUE99_04470 [Bacteroides sp.]|nr:hypothetical protein [Bacteroides sp.]